MAWKPLGTSLEEKFQDIELRLTELLASIPVNRFEREAGPFILIAPEFHWAATSPEQKAQQVAIKRDYDRLHELLCVILAGATHELQRDLQSADNGFRKWLELGRNWSISADATRNLAKFTEDARALHEIIHVIGAAGPHPIVVVPDTNSLMDHPDPVEYRALVGQADFTFALLPTVLAELDNLKVVRTNQPARKLAEKAIRRIKGWRKQGSLLDGVTVDKTITVRTFHEEPDMDNTLSWLDRTVMDDRILASVLQMQAERPGAAVVLVTNDINLLNKADAAGIQAAEFSEA